MRGFILLFFILGVVGCNEEKEAPFGYHWGITPYSVKSKGSAIYTESEEKNGIIVSFTSTVPENGFRDGFYRHYFKNKKLNRIVFNTYDISGDKSNGIAKYEALKSKLIEKYGYPISTSEYVTSDKFNFYPCITNENCGSWQSKFIANDYTIKIYLGMADQGNTYGENRDKGSVYIEYTER
ncbi:hypothetical protein ACMVCI_004589 [Yersinia enterocolitica]|uniref:hypothetical protein n=1 Tax=Yersinia enterocolitica TaxID=630 RepID=UPI00285B4315|nr:hypothetical protein [Yersinia enterocolitica]EKN6114753.1 hypothetical protein [Yersinia enterocolitica]EKN6297702.1 hypothetical protein [Yersinia enterocolitica]ELZ0587031.1 hypothetical protein [Yersinia enterocolitica]EME3604204.1 hypothetical protein [Yersinia enterocolitica]